ncbi:MAG: TRAP transporter small permease subunit [Betaproteobacteria bacterium]|nr:MAG: TRAP transporter small permease subunit [Betaproteobacteria bacterium]
MRSLPSALRAFARAADAVVDVVGQSFAWLVLFVVATLFGQWPLRELLGTGHILANDFGQIAHAAVFAIGIAYALRWDGHVRLDVFYHRMSVRTKALVDLIGTLCIIVPWAGMLLWFSWPTMVRSVAVFEKFSDTWSPGYWLFKVLLIAFSALVLLQAAGHIARDIAQLADPHAHPDESRPAAAEERT